MWFFHQKNPISCENFSNFLFFVCRTLFHWFSIFFICISLYLTLGKGLWTHKQNNKIDENKLYKINSKSFFSQLGDKVHIIKQKIMLVIRHSIRNAQIWEKHSPTYSLIIYIINGFLITTIFFEQIRIIYYFSIIFLGHNMTNGA